MPVSKPTSEPSPPPSDRASDSLIEHELRIGELMLRAAALDTAERSAFLDRTVHDPTLAAAVRRRLAAIDAELPSGFLAEPTGLAAESLDLADDAPLVPEQRYALGERLGAGGMAEVFRATDRQLRRTVAFKRFSPDASRLAGALREARAQAQVHHPNVLEVYETGELDGCSFIAMRHVDGGTLDEIAPRLPLETRIRLLAEVAEGLHAAHRRGLIHRDVKPSNILVEEGADGVLVPFVGDFGIAIDADHADLASLGGIAGTPAYMAPEQLRAEPLDRRVDVYGLGVTLYWLLTARRPFEAEPAGALVTAVLDGTFAPPRAVVPSLPKPLEAIVLRAMAAAPEARYPSARALAEDLRRFLDGEVVEAHAAGLAYRWTRWALRHRALSTVSGIALVVLLAGLVVFTVVTRQAKSVADWRRAQAEELLGFMIGDLRAKLAPVNRLEVLEDVGDRALAYFRSVPADELSPGELAQRSKALYQIGDVRLRRGELGAAREAFEESWRMADDLHRRDSSRLDWLYELGQSHFWIGYVDFEHGDYTAALEHFERYLDIGRRLVEADPENLDYRHELAYGHDNVGRTLERLRRWAPAGEHFAAQAKILRLLIERRPERRQYRAELAVTTILLGTLQRARGEVDAAQATYHDGLDLLRQLAREQPEHHDWRLRLGTAYSFLGALAEERGHLDAATEHYRAQRDLHAELAEIDPDNAEWLSFAAKARISLARVLRWQGDDASATVERDLAMAALDHLLTEDPDNPSAREYRAILGLELAAVAAAIDRYDLVTREATSSLAVFTASTTRDRGGARFAGRAHSWLARTAEVAGELDAARGHWLAAVRCVEPLDELPHRRDLEALADGLTRVGLADEALRVHATLAELAPDTRR